MKNIKKLAGIMMAGLMACGLAACTPKVKAPEGSTVVVYKCTNVSGTVKNVFENLVNTYNNTQGLTDKVFVDAKYSAAAYGQYASELKRSVNYSIATVNDAQIRALATESAKDGFEDLGAMLTDEQKQQIGFDSIPANLINRFSANSEIDSDSGKYLVGEGATLLALPLGSDPHVLYYNKDIFAKCGINMISVSEDELVSNSAYAKVKPHGYAEYAESYGAPYEGATLSVNEAGQKVYKVFNNRIAMNWEEQRCLARGFQNTSFTNNNGSSTGKGYQYGYMSEWWFNYGWTVGGDCIVWDESVKNYTFSLCDKIDNYLAIDDVEINGRSYGAGDVVFHEDALYLSRNANVLNGISSKLHVLPSTYDAFLEFNRLGVPADKTVDAGYTGYEVAPNSTDNRTSYFLTGSNCPLLVEAYSMGALSFDQSAIKGKWDIAPTCQWREFENGSTYQSGGDGFKNEYLKVIGETYADEVYTGDLATAENGTKLVGRVTAASTSTALAIPTNAPQDTKEAALKFICWVLSEDGQKIIGDTNTIIPNHKEYTYGNEFTGSEKRISNSYAAALTSENGDVGDYTYFTSRIWIDNWSKLLNGDVREGKVTLQEFLDLKLEGANNDLKAMTLRIKGR